MGFLLAQEVSSLRAKGDERVKSGSTCESFFPKKSTRSRHGPQTPLFHSKKWASVFLSFRGRMELGLKRPSPHCSLPFKFLWPFLKVSCSAGFLPSPASLFVFHQCFPDHVQYLGSFGLNTIKHVPLARISCPKIITWLMFFESLQEGIECSFSLNSPPLPLPFHICLSCRITYPE